MKTVKKTQPDQIEKEMKLLIKKLNNENAALGKILSNIGKKTFGKIKKPQNTGEKISESQLKNQNFT